MTFYARFTLADPTPRCCRLGQFEWVPDPESAVGASSGDHREVVGRSGAECVQCNCPSEGVVINKTPSPHATVPTDANVRIARLPANVNGVLMRRRMVLSRLAKCEAGISGSFLGMSHT